MRKRLLFLAVTVLAVGGTWIAVRAQVRHYPNQLGGRPGEFHFILEDQANYNRAQFREMRFTLQQLRKDVLASATDEQTRQRMLRQLDGLGQFVGSMESQFTIPVGQTAGEVEERLNNVKGHASCTTCHALSSAEMAPCHEQMTGN